MRTEGDPACHAGAAWPGRHGGRFEGAADVTRGQFTDWRDVARRHGRHIIGCVEALVGDDQGRAGCMVQKVGGQAHLPKLQKWAQQSVVSYVCGKTV